MSELSKTVCGMLLGMLLGSVIVIVVNLREAKTDINDLEKQLSEAREYHLELRQKLRVIDIKLEMLKYSKENEN